MSSCPIWGGNNWADVSYVAPTAMYQVKNSPRAGGSYEVWGILVEAQVKHMSDAQKARLTTWLIDQRAQGNEMPGVTKESVAYAKVKRPLPVHQRAERLLRFIAGLAGSIGERVSVDKSSLGAYAWSESTVWTEVDYCLDYLEENRWTDGTRVFGGKFHGTVTVAGYNHIAEQETNIDSSQAFVAMWFDDSMAECYENGIEPGIRDAGYKPIRIDRKEHINKIDDEIIAEIRRSRFVVADFTQGPDGARGGVYYEAGFAHGLDLPVIFTCRQDSVGQLHFDTSHYNHLIWADYSELRAKLRNRILAVIGQGPEVQGNP